LLGYLFFHPPHQPGFAGLTWCPDSKVMTALFGNSDQLLNALSNQVRAADTKMVAAIHGTVRMKMSHIGNQGVFIFCCPDPSGWEAQRGCSAFWML